MLNLSNLNGRNGREMVHTLDIIHFRKMMFRSCTQFFHRKAKHCFVCLWIDVKKFVMLVTCILNTLNTYSLKRFSSLSNFFKIFMLKLVKTLCMIWCLGQTQTIRKKKLQW